MTLGHRQIESVITDLCFLFGFNFPFSVHVVFVGHFCLVFGDRRLDEDEKLLSSYGIQHLSVIYIVLVVPGGGSGFLEEITQRDKKDKNRSMEKLSDF